MNSDIKLLPLGDIRFGPSYFRLVISGREVADSIFGGEYAVLDGGRFAAFEEWLTTDYTLGPMTRVAIYDLVEGMKCHFESVEKGFVGDFEKLGDSFRYKKNYKGKKLIEEIEVDWKSILGWEAIHP